MRYIAQSTDRDILIGPVFTTDGDLYTTDDLVRADFRAYRNGSFTTLNALDTISAWLYGYYYINAATSDFSVCGDYVIFLYRSGLIMKPIEMTILPAAVYNWLIGGTTDVLGTPTSLDGGTATLAGMLSAIAGSGFASASDTLEEISDAIAAAAADVTSAKSTVETTATNVTTIESYATTLDGMLPATTNLAGAAATDGYAVLASDGLDEVVVETGLQARQALSVIAAATAGKLSGAATNTVTIKAAQEGTTTRISATVDDDGNRSAITLTLPS